MSDYILPTLARMVASRLGYEILPSMGGRMGFTRPGEAGPIHGAYANDDEAWIEAARDAIDTAEQEGLERLVKHYVSKP